VKTKLIESEFATDLIPNSLEYAILLANNYDEAMKNYPLLYFLRGGSENRAFLGHKQPLLEKL
jgi:hypothetical protein